MIFYSKNLNRTLLLILTLISIVLGWLFPNVSCACCKDESNITIAQKIGNLKPSCCWKGIDLQDCACCTSDENLFNANSITVNGCQCELHLKGVLEAKMVISEIPDSSNFKVQLSKYPLIFALVTNTNNYFFRILNTYCLNIKPSVSLNLQFCQLNI